jgi:phospholipid/cholesterol/gamma-HCH transport system substrate-binding protein
MKNRFLEVFFGAAIIISVICFVIYGAMTIVKTNLKTYTVKAVFGNIGTLDEGSKVLISGLKIGNVTKLELTDNYSIMVYMSINSDVKLPEDSVVSIVASSFFDAPDIYIAPTSTQEYVKENGILKNARDWVSLEDKIGSIFTKQ